MSVEYWHIDAMLSGQRLDNYLLTRLKPLPRSMIYRLIRRGEVRVNGRRASPSQRLADGDVVRIPPPALHSLSETPIRTPTITPVTIDMLSKRLWFEDDDFLILNKPAGWAVHGGSGVHMGLIEAIRLWRHDLAKIDLAHRLDRETSGCLVLAKHRQALTSWQEQMRKGLIGKTYITLVKGRWDAHGVARSVITKGGAPSAQDPERKPREALTHFMAKERFEHATLLEATLITGRTHQIRIQCAEAGHPVAGDDRYGDYTWNHELRRIGLRRMFLHAATIDFNNPRSGKHYTFNIPLEEDLVAVLMSIGP